MMKRTRRQFAYAATLSLTATAMPRMMRRAVGAPLLDLNRRLDEIERKSTGRLGVAILDINTGHSFSHQGDDLFPMCSTFKLLACAAILNMVDRRTTSLDKRIAYTRSDLVINSPITEARLKEGALTIADLCAAAMTVSDNTAGNLLLRELGGPTAITAYARAIGDSKTRLDRIEPDLNEAATGDSRDTTTPNAMLGNIQQLIFGEALSKPSRTQLQDWMLANRTSRLRAGFPNYWRVADKTGSGENGTTNDVGVFWPVGHDPFIVSVYLTGASPAAEVRSAIIAEVGRAIASTIQM
ncbi:MAG: beta-lactamase [Hyphomicrobiales bacterium]|nr:beta-lactamase [Hyphomicrobiales bacterium]